MKDKLSFRKLSMRRQASRKAKLEKADFTALERLILRTKQTYAISSRDGVMVRMLQVRAEA
jgi:hypothetical protein